MHALAMKMHTTLMMAWSLAHGCHGGALAYGAYALGSPYSVVVYFPYSSREDVYLS
jgi:hypothetical protein